MADQERRDATRQTIDGTIEFVLDSRTLEARAIDVSDAGVGFALDSALRVAIAFQADGKEIMRQAELVRVSAEEGGYRVGLRFVD